MAYTPCSSSSVAANVQRDCDHPAFEGLKTTAIAVAKNDISAIVRGATQANKNQITAITLKTGKKFFVIEAGGETPFADTQQEFDATTKRWNKTVTFITPKQGGQFASEVVEPLMTDPDGFVVIMQRKNNNGDPSYVVIGAEKGAVGSTDVLNYTDSATSGCDQIALVENAAPSAEIVLWDTDQATTDALFETYLANTL